MGRYGNGLNGGGKKMVLMFGLGKFGKMGRGRDLGKVVILFFKCFIFFLIDVDGLVVEFGLET